MKRRLKSKAKNINVVIATNTLSSNLTREIHAKNTKMTTFMNKRNLILFIKENKILLISSYNIYSLSWKDYKIKLPLMVKISIIIKRRYRKNRLN